MLKKWVMILLTVLISTNICFAKNINLYEQPKTDAKVIGSIDPAKGVVPIFTPKTSDWVKVGDPTNGNVGWVKSNELTDAGKTATGFSFSQKIVDQGKGQPSSYVLQFGVPTSLTPEQSAAFYKQLQKQQMELQQAAEKMFQNIMNSINASGMSEKNAPLIMPIVVMPAGTAPAQTPATIAPTPAPTNQKK